MRWFKLETYIGIEDDRDENDMAEGINGVLLGNLVEQPYYLAHTTLVRVDEAPESALVSPWLWENPQDSEETP